MATQANVLILDSESDLSKIPAGDTIDPDLLGTGTRNGTKFLRDDGTWQTVSGGGGGSASGTEFEVDFGSVPRSSIKVTLAVSGATTSQKVLVQASPKPAAGTGRQADELEFDAFACAAYVQAADSVDVFINSVNGLVQGKYTFVYSLLA